MSRSVFFAGMLVLTMLLGCGTPSDTPGPISKSNAPGQASAEPLKEAVTQAKTMVLKDETTLRYSVHLPKGYDPQVPSPLVFALHYGGKVTPFYGGGMIDLLVAPGLQELNAIIVAPDSIDGAWGSSKNRNAITELLERVKADYRIDEQKTLLTGFSMGGHGTWVIGVEFSDQFKGAIPIAGRGLRDSAAAGLKSAIPFYVIHSAADTVVPIEPTREFVNRAKAAGADVTFVEVPDLPHFKTYEFAKPLSEAVPWVKSLWKMEAGATESDSP